MQFIHFSKMVGTGNDFIVVDNRAEILTGDLSALSERLSDRKLSIGADGLILLEKSDKADVRMRIFNPDGSEAEMCGNGVRCLAKFSVDKGITPNKLSIETMAGIAQAEVIGRIIKVRLSDPKDLKLGLHLEISGKPTEVHFINTGVPHTVVLTDALEEVDIFSLGKTIRQHSAFAPKGTNVDYISIRHDNSIGIRTYERGVEGETLSCGTGSVAGALVAAALKGFESPVSVYTQSQEKLQIYFSRSQERFHDVYLEGPVTKSFEGSVSI